MRHIFTLALLLLLLPVTAAIASQERSPATRGALPDSRITTLPEPDESDIAQANAVGSICSSSTEKNYFDCECVALNYLQQLSINKATGKAPDTYTMKNNAKLACPNRIALAGRNYSVCMGWAPRVRQDYEEFCSCYGNAYADKFAQKPALSLRENKLVMAEALKACNAGSTVTDRMNRNARLKEMQESGTYNEMFPSANTNAATKAQQPVETRQAPLQPWQQMQKSLLVPDKRPRTP